MSDTTTYFLGDNVGTTQFEMNAGGWPVYQGELGAWGQELQTPEVDTAWGAFGGPYTNGQQYAPESFKFTGKERDSETGNDYFGARFFANTFGRFMSPDWSAKVEPVPYSKLDDPQTLNLYSYVRNNPISEADLDGHAGDNPNGDQVHRAPECRQSPVDCEDVNGEKKTSPPAQQQTDNKPVGSTTVGSLEKTMTHEDGSLSTQKGGDPTELEKGKTALANAIINGAESKHPPLVATPTVPASSQDAQIMRDAYTNRANGGADPVNGRTFYGTSHTPPDQLHSRPIGNGRQTVYEHFGPFNDSVGGGRQTYIYIYNDPGH